MVHQRLVNMCNFQAVHQYPWTWDLHISSPNHLHEEPLTHLSSLMHPLSIDVMFKGWNHGCCWHGFLSTLTIFRGLRFSYDGMVYCKCTLNDWLIKLKLVNDPALIKPLHLTSKCHRPSNHALTLLAPRIQHQHDATVISTCNEAIGIDSKCLWLRASQGYLRVTSRYLKC